MNFFPSIRLGCGLSLRLARYDRRAEVSTTGVLRSRIAPCVSPGQEASQNRSRLSLDQSHGIDPASRNGWDILRAISSMG